VKQLAVDIDTTTADSIADAGVVDRLFAEAFDVAERVISSLDRQKVLTGAQLDRGAPRVQSTSEGDCPTNSEQKTGPPRHALAAGSHFILA